MPGLKQMTSTSSTGSSVITLQFALDLAIDVAEQEVQAAINAAGHLPARRPAQPADLQQGQPGRRADPHPGADLRHPAAHAVEDLADTRLAQKISQLPGVGLVSISGGQKPAVRVQANPTALAAYGLTLEDLRIAVASRQREPGQGQLRRAARRPSPSAPTTSC